MNLKKVYLHTVKVCERRLLDAQRIATYLSKNNYELVDHPKKADIIVVITCAFVNERTQIGLQTIKKLLRNNAWLIVGGCLPAIDEKELKRLFDGETFSTKEITKIDNIFGDCKVSFDDVEDANTLWENSIYGEGLEKVENLLGRSNFLNKLYYVTEQKIRERMMPQQMLYYLSEFKNKFIMLESHGGCLGNCSYCAIKKAIGTLHSKPLEICVEEFKKGLNLGYKHFVILADDTGGYGRDIGESLPHLLDEITRIKGNYSIELRDVHPVWIAKYVDELERILKRRKISMIFSGTQSGNERVLKLMNRYSDVDVVEQTFLRLKNASPEMVWGTECIVGFPTENRNEFIDSLKFISTVNFDFGFLHPFSCKHGTEAEGIEPKIPQREIEDRLVFSRRYLKRKGFRIYYGFKPALTFWR